MANTNPLPNSAILSKLVLQSLMAAGKDQKNSEIYSHVGQLGGIETTNRPASKPGSRRTDLEYKLAWVRSSLRRKGLIQRVGPGLWSITPLGVQTAHKGSPINS